MSCDQAQLRWTWRSCSVVIGCFSLLTGRRHGQSSTDEHQRSVGGRGERTQGALSLHSCQNRRPAEPGRGGLTRPWMPHLSRQRHSNELVCLMWGGGLASCHRAFKEFTAVVSNVTLLPQLPFSGFSSRLGSLSPPLHQSLFIST